MNDNKERFEQLGTKIDPAVAEVLNACCDAMQTDVYHLLQWFAYVIVKASAPMHALDPRVQKLMTLLDIDAGWQTAFNLANPDELDVSQLVLILEQKGHKGFGAVMIDKPFMGDAQQTECVDDILERLLKVCLPGIVKRLERVKKDLDCETLSDVLLTMLDTQTILSLDEGFQSEMPGIGDVAPNGKPLAYGKRTKRKKHFSPDTMPTQASLFEDIDHHAPAPELEEWEGERRQHDEPPINMSDDD